MTMRTGAHGRERVHSFGWLRDVLHLLSQPQRGLEQEKVGQHRLWSGNRFLCRALFLNSVLFSKYSHYEYY